MPSRYSPVPRSSDRAGGAIASFKLRHIDIAEGGIDQDAREVRTKFSKSFVTTFFPVGDDIRAVVADWVTHLRAEKMSSSSNTSS
jgi:integrase/recombinase XerD